MGRSNESETAFCTVERRPYRVSKTLHLQLPRRRRLTILHSGGSFAFHADVQIAWKDDALDRALKECNGSEDDNPATGMCKVFTPTNASCQKSGDSPDLGNGEKVRTNTYSLSDSS